MNYELRNFYSMLGNIQSELEKMWGRKEKLREALKQEYSKIYDTDDWELKSFDNDGDYDNDFDNNMEDIDMGIREMIKLLGVYEELYESALEEAENTD